MKLDPQDADAHSMLGIWLSWGGVEWGQADIEFKRALELNPNSADILAYYAGFLLNVQDPKLAVELVDRAIRLSPDGPLWADGLYRSVFFHVRRIEDAWYWHETRPRDRKDRMDYHYDAVLLAELGRADEARAAVAEMLKVFPDHSIEGYLGQPGFPEWEVELIASSMRKAGFPACANEKVLKAFPGVADAGVVMEIAGETVDNAPVADAPGRYRPVSERVAQPIRGTDGGFAPEISPDGREVTFEQSAQIKVVALEGGYAPPRVGQGVVAVLRALCGLPPQD